MATLKTGKILSIFGVKGGIGKSITVLNLAGVCENSKKKILILDLDLYGGSIGIALNKKSEKNVFNFADDVNNHRFNDVKDYITNYSEYIDFIACPKDPRKANKITSDYIELLIEKLKYYYDLILIDTTHVLDEMNLSILDISDSILFMVTNDIFDLKNMKSLISIFKDLEINKYKVLLNDSINIDKNCFNLYDIKNILNNNIDYHLSHKHYIKDLNKYILDGNIFTLEKKNTTGNDYKVLNTIINDCLGDKDE